MRTKYVAGNWKMNMDKTSAVALAKELVENLKNLKAKFMIAPPFVYLDAVAQIIKGSNIILGAQNMTLTDNGAHTGAVSWAMLKDVGVETVILGHSERRDEFNESDKLINEKVKKAVENGLDVVLCIGELYSQRVAGVTNQICENQVTADLKGISEEQLSHISIAYEPVWAIGTGKTATPAEAQEVHAFVRALISRLYSPKAAEEIKILYGGSMNAKNAEELLAQSDIDGGLIGGASLKAETFTPICEFASK
ncbi:MAG: triose-phosphate isomerase [Treponema sp.]|nr:triose-phosphate isomerase [Treponema sp.]